MASYTPGTYEGAARGYGGKLFVRVTVSEDRIEAVTVTQHKEYRGIAWGLNTTPIERYPELIVEYQTLNIPVVDGADLTCAAILDATAAALKAAGASKEDIAALRAAPAPKAPEYPDEVRTVDVVVCGAGAGGLHKDPGHLFGRVACGGGELQLLGHPAGAVHQQTVRDQYGIVPGGEMHHPALAVHAAQNADGQADIAHRTGAAPVHQKGRPRP